MQVGSAFLAMALATVGGMAVVNDYYGYYQTWGELGADVTGNYTQFTSTALGNRGDPRLSRSRSSVSTWQARAAQSRAVGTCTCRRNTSNGRTGTPASPSSSSCTARPATPHRGWCTCMPVGSRTA